MGALCAGLGGACITAVFLGDMSLVILGIGVSNVVSGAYLMRCEQD